MSLLRDITMSGHILLLTCLFTRVCVSGAILVQVVPQGIESVNGSSVNMGCTSQLVDSGGVMICNMSQSYLVDSCSPAIDTSTSDWASQLVTVRKTPQTDEVGFDHVVLTFGFDTAVTLTGIELDLFLCPEWGIGAQRLSVYADVKSNLVFTATSLNFTHYTPSQSSCGSLSTVNISLGDTLRSIPYLTWYILVSSFTPFIDWVHVGEVRFLGSHTSDTDIIAGSGSCSKASSSLQSPQPSSDPSTTTTTTSMSESPPTMPSTDPPSSTPTNSKASGSDTTPTIIGAAIAIVLVLVVLIVVTLVVIMVVKRRKSQLKLYDDVIPDQQSDAVELKSMEANNDDKSAAANPLYTDSSLVNGEKNVPHMYDSAERGLADNPTYYTTPGDPGGAATNEMDNDFYTVVDSQKKPAPPPPRVADENMYASVSEAKGKTPSPAPKMSAPVYSSMDEGRQKEPTPPIYSDIHKPLSPPVPTKSEDLQVYLDRKEVLLHPQSAATAKPSKVSSLPKTVGMSENPNYESADTISQHSSTEADSSIYAQPYFHTACSTTSSNHSNEGIYSESIKPSDFTQGTGKEQQQLEKKPRDEEDVRMCSSIYSVTNIEEERYQQKVEITSANITEQREIGMGQFGKVVLAATNNLSLKDMGMNENGDRNISVYVAVKKLRSNASSSQREAFEKEIKFMSRLSDPNVVRLLGVCYKEPAFIIMEYMEKGDLSQFLQKYTAIAPIPGSGEILTSMVVKMALQIASGMKYLATKNFVHRDLACRNCLVDEKFVVKLADFGMSRNLYESHYYRIQGNAVLPIRWMATECFYGMFSEKTDVWAYGITMWELFILAKDKPYLHLTDSQVVDDAVNRGTNRWLHSRPDPCPEAVYDVMQHCWIANPKERATFESLHGMLQKLPAY